MMAHWQLLATAGRTDELFESVMTQHYDPCYARSTRRNFSARVDERTVELPSLDRTALADTVRRLTA
jgi:tRNA 2-selenouridine synthase